MESRNWLGMFRTSALAPSSMKAGWVCKVRRSTTWSASMGSPMTGSSGYIPLRRQCNADHIIEIQSYSSSRYHAFKWSFDYIASKLPTDSPIPPPSRPLAPPSSSARLAHLRCRTENNHASRQAAGLHAGAAPGGKGDTGLSLLSGLTSDSPLPTTGDLTSTFPNPSPVQLGIPLPPILPVSVSPSTGY